MGQFDSLKSTLPQPGIPGLSDSDRGIGMPDQRVPRPMYVETKKKPKPRPAPVTPPNKPPKNPPKGPTGPKNNDEYGKGNDRNPKKNGYLDKSKKTNKDKYNQKNEFSETGKKK